MCCQCNGPVMSMFRSFWSYCMCFKFYCEYHWNPWAMSIYQWSPIPCNSKKCQLPPIKYSFVSITPSYISCSWRWMKFYDIRKHILMISKLPPHRYLNEQINNSKKSILYPHLLYSLHLPNALNSHRRYEYDAGYREQLSGCI